MEVALEKYVHGGVKEEMKAESNGDQEGCKEEILHKDDPHESAKAEMGEAIQENQRLRVCLDRITKDYRNLQMQFQDIVEQEAKKSASAVNAKHQTDEPDHLLSLCLGRTSSDTKKDEIRKIYSKDKVDEEDEEGLALGLDCNFEIPNKEPVESSTNLSPENSIEQVKQEAGERWPPHKMLKTPRNREDDVSQQNPAKRARVSVRVRCDTSSINDGCQWRKYGQKISKGNPCPRAYYRCTVAPNCPVRKQVQRFSEDMSILITTYEGIHNHSLPVAATAMASTTSAAASMLLSASSNSGSGPSQSANGTITSTDINGMNYYLYDNSTSKPFYLPDSSISSSLSIPTITLDLTSSSSSTLSPLTRVGSFPPRYCSTNLNFSSLESNALPITWSNGVLNYGTTPHNNHQTNSRSFGKQPQDNLCQSYLQKNIMTNTQPPLPPDTIAAATKAITSDPSFHSVLAAALSSIIGSASGNATTLGNQVLADNKPGQSLKLSEPFPVLSSFPSTSNADKCASSFLNKTPSSTNSQPESVFSLHPSLPFSTSKSKSISPGDNRDHIL